MATYNSLYVMLCDMLMETPCFLMWMSIGAAGWEPTGGSSRLGGPHASTHACKIPWSVFYWPVSLRTHLVMEG